MREFFKGWRRKVGCVALVMACAVMGMWVRSHRYWDHGDVPFRGVVYSLNSESGALAIARTWTPDGDITDWYPCGWETGEDESGYPTPSGFFELREAETPGNFGVVRYEAILISHLSISLALALLSAYLILRKPRKPHP